MTASLGALRSARTPARCAQGHVRQRAHRRGLAAVRRRRRPLLHRRPPRRHRHRHPRLRRFRLPDARQQADRDHLRAARRQGRPAHCRRVVFRAPGARTRLRSASGRPWTGPGQLRRRLHARPPADACARRRSCRRHRRRRPQQHREGRSLVGDAQSPDRSSRRTPASSRASPDIQTAEIQRDRLAAARRCAAEWSLTIVLKGANTVVAAPDGRARLSPFANPGLATGGTGDVLAGAITGLIAQGLEPFEAASPRRLPPRPRGGAGASRAWGCGDAGGGRGGGAAAGDQGAEGQSRKGSGGYPLAQDRWSAGHDLPVLARLDDAVKTLPHTRQSCAAK